MINKQNVNSKPDPNEEASCTISQIITFMIETYKFEICGKEMQSAYDLKICLFECVKYLLNKNKDKIFIHMKHMDDEELGTKEPMYKLNSVYIHEKLIKNQQIGKTSEASQSPAKLRKQGEVVLETLEKPIGGNNCELISFILGLCAWKLKGW